MREFILEANIKLISLNHAFATLRNSRRVRSKEYVKFAAQIKQLMISRNTAFKTFEATFKPLLHEIHAELRVGMPNLFTKAGSISLTSGDIANYEKALTDNVLTGKVSDAYITEWKMCKFYSADHYFLLKLEIVDR